MSEDTQDIAAALREQIAAGREEHAKLRVQAERMHLDMLQLMQEREAATQRYVRTARRDQFAAAALTGLLANTITQQGGNRDDIAAEAWRQADAMLAVGDAVAALDGTEGK